MTGYAQVKGQAGQESAPVSFSLSLKAVNHRFLDLNMRLPAESDALEMKLRRLLKEKMARGHLDVTLTLERTGSDLFSLNRELVGGYLRVYRAAAQEFGITAEPDLNAVFKLPGALMASAAAQKLGRCRRGNQDRAACGESGDELHDRLPCSKNRDEVCRREGKRPAPGI